MNERVALTGEGKLSVLGLGAAAAGLLILFATNNVPANATPFGVILLSLGAIFVAFVPWRWSAAVGMFLSLFVLVGAFIAPGRVDRLTHPTLVGAFVGTWIQVLGLMIAIIAGGVGTIRNFSFRPGREI